MHYLTSLRGIAALLVVFYHLKHITSQHEVFNFFSPIINNGYLAVDFFFLLSGFIISYNYYDQFKKPFQSKELYYFLVKRIARIFPLHFFVMIAFLAFPAALFLTGREIDSNLYGVDSFVIKLFLIDLWVPNSPFWSSWNFPSWTISGEWLSYLLFPFVIFIITKLKLSIILFSLFTLCIVIIPFHSKSLSSVGHGIEQLGLIRCVGTFLTGICVFKAYNSLSGTISESIAKISLTLSIVAISLLFYFIEKNYYYIQFCFAWILLSLLLSESFIHKTLNAKVFVFLGEISYSVYLTHIFVRTLYTFLFLETANSGSILDVFTIIILCILTSIFTYRYVERPSRKLLIAKLGTH